MYLTAPSPGTTRAPPPYPLLHLPLLRVRTFQCGAGCTESPLLRCSRPPAPARASHPPTLIVARNNFSAQQLNLIFDRPCVLHGATSSGKERRPVVARESASQHPHLYSYCLSACSRLVAWVGLPSRESHFDPPFLCGVCRN